jgi:hypothetical protein
MWRYYAAATVIVLLAGSILFGHRLQTGNWDLRAQPSGTPTVTRGTDGEPPRAQDVFVGEGPWVLSALPACFDQQSAIEGTTPALRFDVPPARERIGSGTILHFGPCTVVVRAHDLLISRGRDRLRVPQDAGLYQTPKGLVLVYQRGGHAQIRVYHDAQPLGAANGAHK